MLLIALLATALPVSVDYDITSEGRKWTVHAAAPRTGSKMPLVLLFHGAGGNGDLYLDRYGWDRLAEKQGFVVVAPDGIPANPDNEPNFLTNPRVWNSGILKAGPRSRIDDVAFVRTLIADAKKRWSIDTDRIYVAGHSNGASMSYRLGIDLSDQLAAIAPVMGQNATRRAKPAHPVPTLALLGTEDPLNPLNGGVSTLPWANASLRRSRSKSMPGS